MFICFAISRSKCTKRHQIVYPNDVGMRDPSVTPPVTKTLPLAQMSKLVDVSLIEALGSEILPL